jgi:hypothetical protein
MGAGSDSEILTHASVIDAFGGPASYAAAIGIPDSHARAMKTRDSIGAGYWRRTAAAAAARNLDRITFARVAEIAAIAAEQRLAVNEKIAGGSK